jgi:hypothetical protein
VFGAGVAVLMSALVTMVVFSRFGGHTRAASVDDHAAPMKAERSRDVVAAPTMNRKPAAASAVAVSTTVAAPSATAQPSPDAAVTAPKAPVVAARAVAVPTTVAAPSMAPAPSHSAAVTEPSAAPSHDAAVAISSVAPSHDAAVTAPKRQPVIISMRPASAHANGAAPERVDVSTSAASNSAAAPAPSAAPEAGSRSPAPAASPKELGELAIIVRPWASITLNGKDGGVTPFRENVPAGRYRIRIYNDDIGRSDTVTVTVEPNKTTTVERKWYRHEREAHSDLDLGRRRSSAGVSRIR